MIIMDEPDYLALIMAKILKHPTTHILETVADEKVLEYLLVVEDNRNHRVLEISLTQEEFEFLDDFQLTYYF